MLKSQYYRIYYIFILLRNIEELQEQNQRLLTVIRELSEEKEVDEQREKNNLA